VSCRPTRYCGEIGSRAAYRVSVKSAPKFRRSGQMSLNNLGMIKEIIRMEEDFRVGDHIE